MNNMKKHRVHRKRYQILVAIIVVALGIGSFIAYRQYRQQPKPTVSMTPKTAETSKPTTTETPKTEPTKPTTDQTTNPYGLVPPIADFRARITKKFFGTYITPATSPIQPERFQGYHSGDDVEYGDVTSDVAVHAIADGTVIYSGWVSGYGGVEILHHQIQGVEHSVLYGHLRPSSLLSVGTTVTQNQQIAVLGTAYSHETDGERRHLHFSILAGSEINLRGYSTTQAGLSTWLDPLSFYPAT